MTPAYLTQPVLDEYLDTIKDLCAPLTRTELKRVIQFTDILHHELSAVTIDYILHIAIPPLYITPELDLVLKHLSTEAYAAICQQLNISPPAKKV